MKIDHLFDEGLRRTGRTTRMLEKAEKLAKEGKAVYILAANTSEQERIQRLLGNRASNLYDNDLGISVETQQTARNFNWDTMSLLGAHPNCVVLVDHFAVESEIVKRLRALGPAIRSLISDKEEEDGVDN